MAVINSSTASSFYHQLVKIQDVIDTTNTEIKNKIYNTSGYVWWRETAPSVFTQNYVYALRSSGSASTKPPLSELKAGGTFAVGKKITWNIFLTKIKTLFLSWITVRKIHYARSRWHNTMNNGPTYKEVYWEQTKYGSVCEIESSLADKLDLIDYKGVILSTSSIIRLMNDVYKLWANLPTLEWNVLDPCHTNCHDSCHGSGGYR